MNEKSPKQADIIPFRGRVEMLDGLTDSEVIEHFLAELRHPGVRARTAEYILEYTGNASYEGLPPERIAWRERMRQICNVNREDPNVDVLTQEFGKEIIKSDSDEVIGLIEGALISTKNRSQDLVQERRALRALLDVREAAIRRGIHDTEEWENIVDRLIPSKES
jgi:hypothetical protein